MQSSYKGNPLTRAKYLGPEPALVSGFHCNYNRGIQWKEHNFSFQSHNFTDERINGSFVLHKENRENVIVSLNMETENKIRTFEIIGPNGKTQQILPNFYDGIITMSLPGLNDPGEWFYNAELYSDEEHLDPVVIDVTSNSDDFRARRIHVFTNLNSTKVFVRVTSGGSGISRSNVSVLLTKPDGGRVDVTLRDDGLGNPDITSGDGIYSAYLPFSTNRTGFYSLSAFVSGYGFVLSKSINHPSKRCCGSKIGHDFDMEPSRSYDVRIAGPSFYGLSESRDVFPPSRITDFRVSVTEESLLYFEWTSPGGDYDMKKAEKYEIRSSIRSQDCVDERFNIENESSGSRNVRNSTIHRKNPSSRIKSRILLCYILHRLGMIIILENTFLMSLIYRLEIVAPYQMSYQLMSNWRSQLRRQQ